ncbi:DUF4350 domain-containing protein [Rossellomorea aquimaris]|uniref:DUF4350 domain-containing protein n=1 Tax=Rossellomorea aquimaris TaxID=189382 RepID=UPI0024956A01|nr:DUF4350 domain-containing protein [Rossellomorea aquimaris]
MKTNIKAWVWLATLLSLFIIIGVFLSPEKAKEYPAYVSESPSPSGIKALYTYLENEGASIQRWSFSPDKLPATESDRLLIMIEPFSIPEQEEMEAYENFMKAGNTILLLKDNPKGMFDTKTVLLGEGLDNPLIRDQKGNTYQTDLLSGVRLETSDEDTVLLDDREGTIAYSSPIGKGQLIVSTSPGWMMNGNILDSDHLQLVLTLLESGLAARKTILVDEYLHGGESEASLTSLYPQWLLLLILQLLILTILWLWMRGKRFGGTLTPREETVRFSDERIKALSAWYLKGRQYKESLVIQVDYVRVQFQERWGIPTSKEWSELNEPLERRLTTVSKKEIDSVLSGIRAVLEKERISKQEFVQWSKKIELFRKEVEDR